MSKEIPFQDWNVDYQSFTTSYAKKLSNYKQLHSLAKFFYKQYYNIVGPFHVLPDFIILGPGRGGTTSLFNYLMHHPNIFLPKKKEINFFNLNFQKGVNWYRMFFPLKWKKSSTPETSETKFVTGESSPSYLRHYHAPKRAAKVVPKAKLISLLRNPIDREYAYYQMKIRSGQEKSTFAEVIKREEKRPKEKWENMQKDENFTGFGYSNYSYLYSSIYADQLERWMKVFPREQFLIIKSEDFYENSHQVFQEVLEFLNLPKLTLSRYGNTGKKKYSEMDPSIRKQLKEYFKPHNERLSKLVGKNFDWN